MNVKQKIINSICYTPLVYERINKKLALEYSEEQIEIFILNLLDETDERSYARKGKNFYISNIDKKIRITVNANTFRIITVDRL